ncbi:IS5 family transposase [Runella slithyformis]|uniref:Transposase IS4 family protein n=1 Tax=Runella slithyformis (strain ATCC 29530 / DSM 19594 / LMG 11500 / NCIMB 11436 / LSU 4) TaxID=761193 RepID=A0A7U3ZLA2_RUNSL|nr:IS5 family transposase [Runella slithyformis]AEI49270.1 transposase IS4 family protein [Runella slithyformis DSM 19594]AEI50679.1 transposase IS4 family protein [Runella slithyformis DSM 19594]AEI50695.1 transposase IS4 family protein [Runella slithyformis DSM 19594]AEI51388.1 transposase IS4 family protein [Runella slithyformis DSM 19594]AEI51441.1 transposase IS4 family protein [Runella slithyformis DSM 19594]
MPKIHFFTQAENLPPKAQRNPPIPKEKYRLTNWPEYNKALINRGFVTLWLNEKTLTQWYYQGPRTRGGLLRYSDQCIQAALALKAAFRLAFRQTQGLIQSLLAIMKIDIQVPSYSQLCRRQAHLQAFHTPQKPTDNQVKPIHLVVDSTGLKVYGEGEWKVRKHGADQRRTWRKLHLVADEATNTIHAVELTTHSISDAEMIKPLLADIEWPIAKLRADGAYDQVKVFDELEKHWIQPVIPPRSNAVIWTSENGNDLIHPRNEAVRQIRLVGIAAWKQQIGYHRRSKAETAMFRWKMIFGERLSARLVTNQQTEAQIKATCLNRFTRLGMPKTVKRLPT